MLRLLIVDDEKIIRETVRTFIDWHSLGIEVVGLCKNGLEAYDAILDHYPDIVLTDIRMPRLSGLDLIERILPYNRNIQFIILSGYNDFAYAKEAMKYGVKQYVLKPCNEQEIIEAVLAAAKDHAKEMTQANLEEEINTYRLQRHMNLLKDILIQVLSSAIDISTLPKLYESYIDFYDTSCELCFLHYVEETAASACIREISEFVSTCYPDCFIHYIYVKNTLTFFFINKQSANLLKLDGYLNQLCHISGSIDYLYHRTSCNTFLELLETLAAKVRRYETISLFSAGHMMTICNYDSMFTAANTLSNQLLLDDLSENSYQEYMKELKQLLLSVKNVDLLRSLISSLLLKSVNSSVSFAFSDTTEQLNKISSLTSNDEICRVFFDKLEFIYPLPQFRTGKYKPFIQEILNYTQEHLHNPNLNLKWIVENHLYMNVDYVSSQFALQTGTKFSTYLNTLRINKAKQLLLSCEGEKIYCVAEQIGCGNTPQYFSHLFKKYTQMTPKEYIQKMKSS